jgi:hypothetical protein
MLNLFSLPHLPARKTKGMKLSVDYNQFHVVTLDEYLNILQRKIIEKETTNEVSESKCINKEEKHNRKIVNEGTTTNQIEQRSREKKCKD